MSSNSPDNLNGQTVLVPRPAPLAGQTDKLADLLVSAGVRVVAHPVIKLASVPLESIASDLDQLDQFETIVFLSATSVHFFTALLHQHSKNTRNRDLCDLMANIKIAAIGPGSAAEIEKLGLPVHFIPDRADSTTLANGLIRSMEPPFLVIRANRGSSVLADILTDQHKPFQEVAVYESVDIGQADDEITEQLESGEIDWLALTSPAIARNSLRLFGKHLHHVHLATISSDVSSIVVEHGFKVAVEAVKPGFAELIQAMQSHRH